MFGSYKVYFKLGIIHFICSNQEDIRITKPLPHTVNSKKIQNESEAVKTRSSRAEVFLGKGVLKICSKFTREHPCRSAKKSHFGMGVLL